MTYINVNDLMSFNTFGYYRKYIIYDISFHYDPERESLIKLPIIPLGHSYVTLDSWLLWFDNSILPDFK